jgi:hypothetical protein
MRQIIPVAIRTRWFKRAVSRQMERLHIGAGTVALRGWWNVDMKPGKAIDQVLDVRDGLPFHEARSSTLNIFWSTWPSMKLSPSAGRAGACSSLQVSCA